METAVYRNNLYMAFLGLPLGPRRRLGLWDIAPTYLSFFFFLGESVLPPDTVRGGNSVHR